MTRVGIAALVLAVVIAIALGSQVGPIDDPWLWAAFLSIGVGLIVTLVVIYMLDAAFRGYKAARAIRADSRKL